MFRALLFTITLLAAANSLSWRDTKFLITFGDSYSADGFNISAGVNSIVPGFVCWLSESSVAELDAEPPPSFRLHQTVPTGSKNLVYIKIFLTFYLSFNITGSTYNVNPNMKVFNLASGGATIDAALVPPYLPTVLSIVDQVSQFKEILAPKPAGANWMSNDTLFAIWIGINDVGTSSGWTNISQPETFYDVLMNRLTTQLDILYESGARSFLLLTVPPTNRAPLFIQQGPTAVARIHLLNSKYNERLERTASKFRAKHAKSEQDGNGEGKFQIIVFDTQPVFNTLLDNAENLGYVNQTGFCEAYQNGTPALSAQTPPCAPVSSYFWLNTLHPLYTVHDTLARAISTKLSAQK